MKVMRHNLMKHGVQSAAVAIGAPMAFKFSRKIFRRPIRAANKMLKGTGVRI
jgi:hypothetical protein